MASETEKGIYDDPNFAIICSFLNNYGSILQFPDITFNALKSYIETSNRKGKDTSQHKFRVLIMFEFRTPVFSLLYVGGDSMSGNTGVAMNVPLYFGQYSRF